MTVRAYLIVAFLSVNSFMFAEQNSSNSMAVNINPLSLLSGKLTVNYEVEVAKKIAIVLPTTLYLSSFDFSDFLPTWINNSSGVIFAISTGIGTKFFLSGESFENGWYLTPAVLFGYKKYGDMDNFELTLEVLGGYGWVFKNGFSINLGVGIQASYLFNGPSNRISLAKLNVGRLPYPTGEFNLGYAF